MTTIREAKDLNILTLEELLGSLMTHELAMKQYNDDEIKKKRTTVLKSMVEEEKDDDSSKEDVGDKDMALITRKFKKFLKKKWLSYKKKPMTKKESSKDKDKERDYQTICYECKKIEYFKANYPNLKKNP